jgi:hypothetical protein
MLNAEQTYLLRTIVEEYIGLICDIDADALPTPVEIRLQALLSIQQQDIYIDYLNEFEMFNLQTTIKTLKDIVYRDDTPKYLKLEQLNGDNPCTSADIKKVAEELIKNKINSLKEEVSILPVIDHSLYLKKIINEISAWLNKDKSQTVTMLKLKTIQDEFNHLLLTCQKNHTIAKRLNNFLELECIKPYYANILDNRNVITSQVTAKYRIISTEMILVQSRLNAVERLWRDSQKIFYLEKIKTIIQVQKSQYTGSVDQQELLDHLSEVAIKHISEFSSATEHEKQIGDCSATLLSVIAVCCQLLSVNNDCMKVFISTFEIAIGKAILKNHPEITEQELINFLGKKLNPRQEEILYGKLINIRDATWILGFSNGIQDLKNLIKSDVRKEKAITIASTLYGAVGGIGISIAIVNIFALPALSASPLSRLLIAYFATAILPMTPLLYSTISWFREDLEGRSIPLGFSAGLASTMSMGTIAEITGSLTLTILPTALSAGLIMHLLSTQLCQHWLEKRCITLDINQRQLIEERVLPILAALDQFIAPLYKELSLSASCQASSRFRFFASENHAIHSPSDSENEEISSDVSFGMTHGFA